MFKVLKEKLISLVKYTIRKIESYEYRYYSLDEDDISKKILNSISLSNIKVETDTGYEVASDIHITQPYKHYKLKTKDFNLSCADNHILFDCEFNEIFTKDLKVGDIIQTEMGQQEIISIGLCDFVSSMFDLSIDHPNHRYYTNGILSHNTVSASIFMLHTILFSNDKNVMIVANKSDTAIEIVDKIKSIYSLLPFFLKPGIKIWNLRSLTFENGCRVKTSARTKTPAIGFTIDLLYLDEFAHIPSNIIEPYYTAAFPTVSAIENSKIIITSTPNGMNLFHKLLTDAERPDGDPKKNNYKALRVYWHQVPGRFVTNLRLNDHKLYENGIDKEYVFESINKKFDSLTNTKMGWNIDLQKDIISVFNNERCSDEDVRGFMIKNSKGEEIPLLSIGEMSTWKEEAIKDIGGEDAFNQEYGLRFINASKSLLSESIIDELMKNKKNYTHEKIHEFDKLRFSYEGLKWIDDINSFIPIMCKDYKFVISVDIAEGLGQDYSIVNIFRINNKKKEVIDLQKESYKSIVDFFKLEQVGMFRSNIVSVKQLAEFLYVLVFEYLNPENVKVVLELNNYGNTLLAELPHVFDGNNNYGSSVFVRYKHRVDANEEKVGLKVGENKNLMVKDYQDLMMSKSFAINNEETIREVTTFVKHITTAGNFRYAADVGHDDCLLPDTLIKTINGYIKIKDIKTGDLVLTHLGNYKKVTNICIKNFNGDMYKVKFKGQPELDITYNHPIYIASESYSRKEYKKGNYNVFKKRDWVLPNKIKSKYRCVNIEENYDNCEVYKSFNWFDLFDKHKNLSEKNIKIKNIVLDLNFSKFLGLFLADGNCYKPSNNSYRISIDFNKNDIQLINEIKDILDEWGLNWSERFQNKNGYVLTFYNRTFFELLVKCYDVETKEKILPYYYRYFGDNLKYILEYWIKGANRKGRSNSVIGCSTSLQLALSMRDISLSLGKHAIINKNIRSRYGKKTKDQYCVTIYDKRPKSSSLKKISNFEYSSVISKSEKYNYNGTTYNLEVDDDNSYIANGIVVHNCVMTIVNATSIFKRNEFTEMVEEWANKFTDKELMDYINTCLKNIDYVEGVDYSQVLKIRKQYMSRSKGSGYTGGSWFGLK